MIQIQNASVAYGDGKVAVDELSLHIKAGEKVALIGANGAGKSTLLLALLGVLPLAGGEIGIDGLKMDKKNLREIRKHIGLVFQNPDDQLFMAYVHEEIAFGPRNYGLNAAEVEKRVDRVLQDLDITGLRDRMPQRLSGGEKRMVAIAAVLSMEPGALLFDEPSSFLDPKARRSLIATLKGRRETLVIATHDLPFAEEICDRVVFLQNGRLIADGPAATILQDSKLLENGGL